MPEWMECIKNVKVVNNQNEKLINDITDEIQNVNFLWMELFDWFFRYKNGMHY